MSTPATQIPDPPPESTVEIPKDSSCLTLFQGVLRALLFQTYPQYIIPSPGRFSIILNLLFAYQTLWRVLAGQHQFGRITLGVWFTSNIWFAPNLELPKNQASVGALVSV